MSIYPVPCKINPQDLMYRIDVLRKQVTTNCHLAIISTVMDGYGWTKLSEHMSLKFLVIFLFWSCKINTPWNNYIDIVLDMLCTWSLISQLYGLLNGSFGCWERHLFQFMSWGIYQVGWVNLDIERDIVSIANYDDIHEEGQPRDTGAPGGLSTG